MCVLTLGKCVSVVCVSTCVHGVLCKCTMLYPVSVYMCETICLSIHVNNLGMYMHTHDVMCVCGLFLVLCVQLCACVNVCVCVCSVC